MMAENVRPFQGSIRVQPQDIEAEQALLGAILVNNDGYHAVSAFLKPEHFYEPVHGRIFAAMAAQISRGGLADHHMLRRQFDQDPALADLDGARYLAGLARAAETILNVADYGHLIHDLAVKRGLIQIGEQLLAKAYDPDSRETGGEQIGQALAQLDSLGHHAESASDALAPIDPALILEAPRPPREWLVDQYIPAGRVTLLAGDGGTGKTLLSQQLAVCMAAGKSWMGAAVRPGRVAMLACEDEEPELARRLHDICGGLGIAHDDFEDRLAIICRVGKENRLVKFEQGEGSPSGFWHHLCRWLDTYRPQLLIIDHAAQVFTGNENARTDVTWFCNRLEHLCQAYQLSILLLCHTSKAIGSQYSGSTGWSNSVRSRLLIQHDPDNPDLRKLIRPKTNYAKMDNDGVSLAWVNGMLKPERDDLTTYADRLTKQQEEGRVAQIFLDALDYLTARQIATTHYEKRAEYAPKVMIAYDINAGCTVKQLADALLRLIKDERVRVSSPLPWTRSQGRPVLGITRP